MKKSFVALLLFTCITSLAVAQTLRKTEKINSDQVPVSIRASFQNDFANVPEGGQWLAHFILERDGARTVAKPLSYIYKNKGEKIEIRYAADGKLESVKGIQKSGGNNTPT